MLRYLFCAANEDNFGLKNNFWSNGHNKHKTAWSTAQLNPTVDESFVAPYFIIV